MTTENTNTDTTVSWKADKLEDLNSSWHSYAKVFALGHRAVSEILLDDVIVEEKLDGSQFSFGIFNGELKCRSKGVVLNLFAPDKMFIKAVEVVNLIKDKLHDGWTYRAEYLAKSSHNTLAYERTPVNHLMIFDINTAQEKYLSYDEKKAEAERLGFECMPILYRGKIESPEMVRGFLDRVSVLGGQKIEGVVVKNYARFSIDGKALIGKFVSEEFKEVHNANWKEKQPGSGDIVDKLVAEYRTPARWNKAIQHLAESNSLAYEPKDIGALISEAKKDILTECSDEIKDKLFKWAWQSLERRLVSGIAEHYKEFLLKRQFEKDSNA